MTIAPIRRNASSPAAGGFRGATKGGLAGLAAAYVFQETGSVELAGAAAAVVSGLLGWLGKRIREKGVDTGFYQQTFGEII